MSQDARRGEDRQGRPVGRMGDFWRRLLSALVLAALALALTWAGVWPFALMVIAGSAILAWEWAGIVGNDAAGPATVSHAGILVLASVLAVLDYVPEAIAVVLGGAMLLAGLAFRLRRGAGPGLSALGALYFGLPVVALVSIRSDPAYGLLAILFLFVVVWCEDTAAYIFGRLLGGPRLAPSISPGKTWSGLGAGVAVPALAAFLFAKGTGNGAPVMLALVGAVLALVAQFGDLVESATKRAFAIKDASRLIPGHGGLMDRVDGFIFAAVASGLLALVRDRAHPGQALLIWP